MKSHRILAIAISVILVLSLAGCTGTNGKDSSTSQNSSVTNNANDIMHDKSDSSSNEGIEEKEVDLGSLDKDDGSSDTSNKENKENKESIIDTADILSSLCTFRVIDCGQADSILISSKEFVVLIDAGDETNATAVRNVLDNQGISKIDILVATHPHSDHIGGMKTIVENYDIDKIIMSPTGHTSKAYENLLIAIDDKGKTITKAEDGNEYTLGKLKLKIVAPISLSGDLNEDSVVILASYGDTDVLLTGDAGFQSEKTFAKKIGDIEVLKVGHHGSKTSTSDNLLDITKPEVAAISCGENNQYGHPNQETLDKLNKRGIQIFTTEQSGDIMVRTDGKDYTVETSKDGKIETTDNNQDTTNNTKDNTSSKNNNTSNTKDKVYITEKGSKYHYTDGCSRLYTSKNILETTEKEARSKGLEKCSKCW